MTEENRDSGTEAQPSKGLDRSQYLLSVPWGDESTVQHGSGDIKSMETFLKGRNEVHSTYIREEWKTKRLSLILATIFALGACILVVFAPAGREILAYGIGVALFISAAGAAGYKRVWFKSKDTSLRLHKDK